MCVLRSSAPTDIPPQSSFGVRCFPSASPREASDRTMAEETFHVFLSHNSDNKPAVRELARALKGRGIRYWLDAEQLPPRTLW